MRNVQEVLPIFMIMKPSWTWTVEPLQQEILSKHCIRLLGHTVETPLGKNIVYRTY